MHRDLLDALTAGELRPLREWLARHQVETGRIAELPQWDAGHPDAQRPGRRADGISVTAATISDQWPKAAAAPGGVPMLLLFVLISVEAEWNISYYFQPLQDTLQGAAQCMRDHGEPLSAPDRWAGQAVLSLMDSLAAQIDAENAMITGQLAAHEAALNAAASAAGEAAGPARGAAAEYPDLSGYLIRRAADYETYNDAVARAVRGLRRFLAAGEALDTTIAELEAIEMGGSVADPVSLSELRAHRLSLASLNDRRNEPWLRIDHGKIVYLYPFAVRGVTPQQVVDQVSLRGSRWRLGGVEAVSVNSSLNLDDVWNGSDAFSRRYGGALAELPDVLIEDADRRLLGRAQAEVRFSRLGNHYVRFTLEMVDVTPNQLYSMMLRGAPEYGAVRITFDSGDRTWRRLSDLAAALEEDVCARLLESEPQALVSPGTFHVVVAVNAASTTQGPVGPSRYEVRSARELLVSMGAQVLTNPVTHLIGSVAEWGRYTGQGDLAGAITGLTGDMVIRTSNTTVINAPGTATFTQGTQGSVVEFAASLHGLFAGWSLELVDYYHRVGEFRDRVDTVGREQADSAATLRALAGELEAEKARLNDFAITIRSTIALIRSPSLLSSPVVADMLRLVLDNSDFERRVRELNTMIEEIGQDQLGTSIERLAKQREEYEVLEEHRRQARQRAKLEVFLAVIAAAGMSGLIQVLQAGFFQSADAATWALVGVSVIFAIAALFGFLFWPKRSR
ncbi:hypothetical protein AGRA3207_007319 [Actinomadura graeca]|uniref:Uncharacterized protein n=1 Tax=Actinomadura graeca TaxID=2750812 RepID=A0ABX8R3Z8_9ACTN|nr:hypothetical protein [Actinomadura graeca]QXJ25770.1 hypothetical protein AGRA3207_007319 [Actinomadura graeca]